MNIINGTRHYLKIHRVVAGVSDYDDEKISIRSTRERTISKNFSNDRRKMQRSSNSGGIFLGCTSHKAVDVVGNYNLNRS